jgi:uncharacterized membrane protein
VLKASSERPWQLVLKITLLALMGLIVGFPLLQPALICGDDFRHHLTQVIELDRLLRQGVWYPRWGPDLVLGYGYPVFTYYPPLPRYAAVALHGLGFPLRDAVNITMALALMAAGPTMYLFARSIYGERAGMAAGLAYAFAPYLAYDALQRYALNEAWALSLMPLAFWTLGRLGTRSLRFPRRWIVGAALAYAALILTHTLVTLMFTPVLAVYLLAAWWKGGQLCAGATRAALVAVHHRGQLGSDVACDQYPPHGRGGISTEFRAFA